VSSGNGGPPSLGALLGKTEGRVSVLGALKAE
jgi:hypothetical protein